VKFINKMKKNGHVGDQGTDYTDKKTIFNILTEKAHNINRFWGEKKKNLNWDSRKTDRNDLLADSPNFLENF